MSENKISVMLKYLKENEPKRLKIIVILGIVGILLIAFSSGIGNTDVKKEQSSSDNSQTFEYSKELENNLKNIISSIEGVGNCEVMLTLENTAESVYATDKENNNSDDSSSVKDEYVIYDSQNGEQPILIKEYYPKVLGVSVVCDGGNNIAVKEKIIEAVTSLFDISANRVSVSKIKE